MSLFLSVTKQLDNIFMELAFTCRSNMLTAIVGPSGSGKTTLMRMLAGLDQPDAGLIKLSGTTWFSSMDDRYLPPQKRKVGLVFQDYQLFPHLTVEKNITFAATDTKLSSELMEAFEIDHLKNKKPHSISGGERQRAAFCQALAREPVLLLLDEPFSALDVATRRKLQQHLLQLKDHLAIPIIHVTHDLEEAALLGDEIFAIEDGKLSPDWLYRQQYPQEPPTPFHHINLQRSEKLNAGT